MKFSKICVLSLSLLLFLSFTFSYAEEKVNEDCFRPDSKIGAIYHGKISSKGNMKCAMTFRMRIPGGYDWDYNLNASYKQQAMQIGGWGETNGSVRFYDEVKYTAKRAKKKIKDIPDLQGRKFFTMKTPNVVLPAPPNDCGMNLIKSDQTDPFEEILPQKSLRMGLEWEPNLDAINRVYERITCLQPTIDPTPPKKPSKNPPKPADDEEETEARGQNPPVPGVLAERGHRPRRRRPDESGEWTPESMMQIRLYALTANARITEFSIEEFTGVVDVIGDYVIPMRSKSGTDVQIPFNGQITFTYSLTEKTLTHGNITLDGTCKEAMMSGTTTVHVDIKWKQEMTIERDNFAFTRMATELKHKCSLFNSPGDKAQALIGMENNGMIHLLANWDGNYAYEVLNKTAPVSGLTKMPIAAGVSSCGQFMLASDGDKFVHSSDYGESFTPVTWKDGAATDLYFLNISEPYAIIKTVSGVYYRADASKA